MGLRGRRADRRRGRLRGHRAARAAVRRRDGRRGRAGAGADVLRAARASWAPTRCVATRGLSRQQRRATALGCGAGACRSVMWSRVQRPAHRRRPTRRRVNFAPSDTVTVLLEASVARQRRAAAGSSASKRRAAQRARAVPDLGRPLGSGRGRRRSRCRCVGVGDLEPELDERLLGRRRRCRLRLVEFSTSTDTVRSCGTHRDGRGGGVEHGVQDAAGVAGAVGAVEHPQPDERGEQAQRAEERQGRQRPPTFRSGHRVVPAWHLERPGSPRFTGAQPRPRTRRECGSPPRGSCEIRARYRSASDGVIAGGPDHRDSPAEPGTKSRTPCVARAERTS